MERKKNKRPKNTKEMIIYEEAKRHRSKINKIILSVFLFIAISALVMKIVDGVLLDLGYGIDGGNGFHRGFWMQEKYIKLAESTPYIKTMVMHHPNFMWLTTQFTWITTTVVILLLVFRLFKYEATIPRWLKWIMTQRTLSLITMYDMIVATVFWASMFQSFAGAFVPSLYWLELSITILVHAVIPFMILVYSVVYLLRDRKASILKEMFVLKGMLYPTIYFGYYMLVSVVWSDPYAITDFHNHFLAHIWKLPVAFIGIWVLLGGMLLIHNIILLRFNKLYDPLYDYEIISRKKMKEEKIRRKVIRQHARGWIKEEIQLEEELKK